MLALYAGIKSRIYPLSFFIFSEIEGMRGRRTHIPAAGVTTWFPNSQTRSVSMSDKAQRKTNVIEVLNNARKLELQAIHQYMNQHYNLDDMDYGELAGNIKLISIDEMRHAELFAERIKELGGEPTSELAAPIVKGQDVRDIFPYDSQGEDDTIYRYNEFRKTCLENGDSLTAQIFSDVISEEQEHYNYFDNVSKHINALGDTYLSKIAGTKAASVPSRGFVNAGTGE